MRLSSFIQRTRALGDTKLSSQQIAAVGEMIQKGADLSTLLKRKSEKLNAQVLLDIWRAARRHQKHQHSLQGVAARRRREGQSAIPPALLKQTLAQHEVEVLERAETLAQPGRFSEHLRRDAIKEAVALWNACRNIFYREAIFMVWMATDQEDLVERFSTLIGESSLKEMPPDRWTQIREGEMAGALELEFELPEERLLEQVEVRGTELSALSTGLDSLSLLQTLVLDDLEEWSKRFKDEEVREWLMQKGCKAFLKLLWTPPATQQVLAGIWVEGEQMGFTVVMRSGKLVAHGEAKIEESALKTATKLIGLRPIEALVLPEGMDPELSRELSTGFAAFPTVWAQTRALEEGVNALKESLPPIAARALLIARRIAQPMSTWAQVDPISLQLVEPDFQLDNDCFRKQLQDVLVLAQNGIDPEELFKSKAKRKAASTAEPALNPSLKSVEDLRPGLELKGLITKLTQFGAFVNIGLSHEGLVHVSEMADHYVKDPGEIVKVEELVSVRVLGVDRARRRISLSLRAESSRTEGRSGFPLDDGTGDRRRRGGRKENNGEGVRGVARAQALADLEALFKSK